MKAHIRKTNYFGDGHKANPRVMEGIIKTVEIQISDNDPPETKQTFERLVAAGYTEQRAKEKIGAVLGYEVYDILHDKRKFDREKFVSDLQKIE